MSRLTDRFPRLTAAVWYVLCSLVTFRAVLAGRWLVNDMSDQRNGYAFRRFAAEHLRATGEVPQWSPYLFGGMPFASNTAHGDTFFPTAWLRLWLGVDAGMSAGFMVFAALAGLGAFLFARGLGLAWAPAMVAGSAYMLGGQVISLVSPGHDGKLFVSALLPYALLALWRAVPTGNWRAYVAFGAVVGTSLLTPHVQMTYYLLMAAGFFWAYLQFVHRPGPALAWPWSAALFAGAIGIGFAIAAIQLVPFFGYIPFSPRGAGGSSTGYDYATAFSLPIPELLDTLWPRWSGARETYWGSNPLRLHSSYLGAAAVVLASLAFRGDDRRRLRWFFAFLAGYATLFALGGNTPFYRIPYTVLPGISKTRAPDMIFFLASLSVSVLAGMGVQALVDRDRDQAPGSARAGQGSGGANGAGGPLAWIAVFLVVALLAASGVLRGLMESMADPGRTAALDANYPAFIGDAARSLLLGGGAALLVLLARRGRVRATPVAYALVGIVALDGFAAAQPFVLSSPPARESYAEDDVVRTLRRDTSLFRVLALPQSGYGENYLMSQRVRSLLGYNGQELQRYDELLGGKNVWEHLGNPNVWRVAGVKYVITGDTLAVPQLARVAGPLTGFEGQTAYVYRFTDALPYAWLVPEAVKVESAQLLPTLLDPRFDPHRILLLPKDAPAGRDALEAPPEPIGTPVTAREVAAGHLRLTLAAPAPRAAFAFVAENWFPAWRATVDGKPATVLRAQHTMLAVPVPAGAREVELRYVPDDYPVGKTVTLLSLAVVLLVFASGPVRRTFGGRARPDGAAA